MLTLDVWFKSDGLRKQLTPLRKSDLQYVLLAFIYYLFNDHWVHLESSVSVLPESKLVPQVGV